MKRSNEKEFDRLVSEAQFSGEVRKKMTLSEWRRFERSPEGEAYFRRVDERRDAFFGRVLKLLGKEVE